MQYKILNEQPWQILSNAMTISPSQTGYDLQVSANGRDYTTMFHVNAGVTRQVTNLSSGSYFRMSGNVGEVVVNWVRDCSGGDSGGGSGSGTTYTAGEYISIDQDVISVTGITPDAYLTSADTQDLASQDYVDAAITAATEGFATEAYVTAATSPIQTQLDDVERVTATALTELHESILELSGATEDFATKAYVTAATAGFMTSADTQEMIEEAVSGLTPELPSYLDQETLEAKEEVIASALTQIEEQVLDLSGATSGYATHAEVTAATQGLATEAYVTGITSPMQTAIQGKVGSSNSTINNIISISQADYDLIVSPDANTFYVITGTTS